MRLKSHYPARRHGIQHLVIILLFALFLTSCSTGRFLNDSELGGDCARGEAYLLGRRVPKNNQKAFHYFHKAADQGNASAQNEVAYMYAAGKGTNKDYKKALFYYQKAAATGLASAQYNLGLMYMHGLGIDKDKILAMKWIEKSAASGFEPARATLKQNRS